MIDSGLYRLGFLPRRMGRNFVFLESPFPYPVHLPRPEPSFRRVMPLWGMRFTTPEGNAVSILPPPLTSGADAAPARPPEPVRLSDLGREVTASVSSGPGAKPVGGLWLLPGGPSTRSPIQVRELVAEIGRLEVVAPLEDVVLSLLNLGTGTVETRSLGELAVGKVVEVSVDPPCSLALVGGLRAGRAWEGHAVFLSSSQPARQATEVAAFLMALSTWTRAEIVKLSRLRQVLAPPELPGRVAEALWCHPEMLQRGERMAAALRKWSAVSDGTLAAALQDQRDRERGLLFSLVHQGEISEREATELVSLALEIPFVDLENFVADPRVVRLVPEELAERHLVYPLNRVGRTLTLACANPLDRSTLEDLASLTGLEVRPVVAAPHALYQVLHEAYGSGFTGR